MALDWPSVNTLLPAPLKTDLFTNSLQFQKLTSFVRLYSEGLSTNAEVCVIEKNWKTNQLAETY